MIDSLDSLVYQFFPLINQNQYNNLNSVVEDVATQVLHNEVAWLALISVFFSN